MRESEFFANATAATQCLNYYYHRSYSTAPIVSLTVLVMTAIKMRMRDNPVLAEEVTKLTEQFPYTNRNNLIEEYLNRHVALPENI